MAERDEASLDRLLKRIKKKFRNYRHKDVSRDQKIDEIREYLEHYRDVGPNFDPYRYRKIMEFITDDELAIDDEELTIEALETFFFIHADRPMVFIALPPGYAIEVVLKHANTMGFDFWGLRRGIGPMANYFNPVVDCFTIPNLYQNTCLSVYKLMQYGFRYTYKFYIYMDRCLDFQHREYIHRTVWNRHGLARMIMDTRQYREMLLIMDTFSAFAGSEHNKFDRIKSLLYIFRTIPDVYVTPTRMLDVITPVVHHRFLPYLFNVFIEYRVFRNTEVGYFEQDDETLQPRKLQHLCRCRVRDALADNLNLPDGIDVLEIPRTLKGYLHLES